MVVKVDTEIQRAIYEREKLQEWIDHPGTRIVALKLKCVARAALKRQIALNPYTDPDKIMQSKQLRHVLNRLLPEIIEGIVNYDPDTIDKKVAPKKRFRLFDWLKKFCGKR